MVVRDYNVLQYEADAEILNGHNSHIKSTLHRCMLKYSAVVFQVL